MQATHFESWDAYSKFEREVRERNRYGQSKHCKTFLEAVRTTAHARVALMKDGSSLWRAQVGCDSQVPDVGESDAPGSLVAGDPATDVPYSVDRMKPTSEHAGNGRLNPRGLACLYLAGEPDTAVAEVRPWLGAPVSVGLFRTARMCKVLWCTLKDRPAFLRELDDAGRYLDPPPARWDDCVWNSISWAFARPLSPAAEDVEYAPTQLIAEVLRDEGLDGVAYQSAMRAAGTNYALFEPTLARLVRCELVNVDSISYTVAPTGRSYSL